MTTKEGSVLRTALAALLALAAAVPSAGQAGPEARITVGPRQPATVAEATLFAFDDVSIPFTGNLTLTMHPPKKHPANPVLPLGEPGEPDEWQHRYYGTVIRHDGKFKMWYIACAKEAFLSTDSGAGTDFDARGLRFAYAESDDGVRWRKPNLGLVEFRGSRNNNLIQVPKGFVGYHTLVVHDPGDPDATRRFKMLALIMEFGDYRVPWEKAPASGGVWVRRGSLAERAYVPMYSADGLRWRVAEEVLDPKDPHAFSPKASLVVGLEGSGLYRWNGLYYLTGQGGPKAAAPPYERHIQVFRSPDLLHWSTTQTMGYARQGQFKRPTHVNPMNNEQTHEGVSVWNRGNVLVGLTGFWHGATDWNQVTHDFGFLVSNDGIHFREPLPDFIFAAVGEDGREWDTGGLSQGQGFENVGDQTYIWYGQMDQREGTRTGRPWARHGGIGLLVLDRDRFGSLAVRNPSSPGTFITCDLEARGPITLSVNADGLSPDAYLKVELLDYAERPIAGFSGERAALVRQPGLRVPVAWSGSPTANPPAGPFKVKVTIDGPLRAAASVYALYVGP
jgi:hypothetical protein